MGLDIDWYRGLSRDQNKTELLRKSMGTSSEHRVWAEMRAQAVTFSPEDEFDVHGDIEPYTVYRFLSGGSERIGGYGFYNVWRALLDCLSGGREGVETVEEIREHILQSCDKPQGQGSFQVCPVWFKETREEAPFVELIDFSDCEGVIGTRVCAKLYRDFTVYREDLLQKLTDVFCDDVFQEEVKLHNSHREKFGKVYDIFAHAFREGAAHGAVVFC